MFEPRGHDVMSGSILYPPTRPDCDLGVLFIEVSGCLPMCGHGTIGTVTVAMEEGLVTPKLERRLALEMPAGRVEVVYERNGRLVEEVRLFNIPSYLHAAEAPSRVPALVNSWSTWPMAATTTPSSSRRRTGPASTA